MQTECSINLPFYEESTKYRLKRNDDAIANLEALGKHSLQFSFVNVAIVVGVGVREPFNRSIHSEPRHLLGTQTGTKILCLLKEKSKIVTK